MSKYLVQEVKDYFDHIVLTNVLEVLQQIESDYGTIVVVKYDTDEGWIVEPQFLQESLEFGYIFSDDEKYKDWVNQ